MYVEDGYKILLDMGINPITVEDPDDNNVEHFFTDGNIIWDKMFTHLKNYKPELYEMLDTVPHIKWVKNIIISRNPKLENIEIEGQNYFGVRFKELMERGEQLQHLDRCLGYVFMIIQEYITEIFNKFD